jgi:predicted GNAT family acetyltransferase
MEPDPAPPGAARVAGEADRALLVDRFAAFGRDVGEEPAEVAAEVDRRMGRLRLWEVDGEPVSMAGSTRPSSGMVRVNAVYTPPRRRRHGYAAAVTAAVTRAALEAGASDAVLFTDLANPTSNAVYARLGYRPVEDRTLLIFG